MSPSRLGYNLLLPPAWTKIPLLDGTEAKVDEILDNSFRGLPMDTYGPHRHELKKKLMAQVEAARAGHGIDLFLPVERMHGVTIAASFVVGLLVTDVGQTAAADDVIVALAGELAGASLAEVDDSPAVRTETSVAATEAESEENSFGSRRVNYIVAIPGETERFLTISFSTIGDGDPDGQVADVLVDLFDAVVSTFSWVESAVA